MLITFHILFGNYDVLYLIGLFLFNIWNACFSFWYNHLCYVMYLFYFLLSCIIYYTRILKVVLYVSRMDIRHYIRWRYAKHTIAFIHIIVYITCYILCRFLVVAYYVLQIVYGYFSESYLLNLKWIYLDESCSSFSLEWPTLCRLAARRRRQRGTVAYEGWAWPKRAWPCQGVLEAHTLGESWWRNWFRRGSSCTAFVCRGF